MVRLGHMTASILLFKNGPRHQQKYAPEASSKDLGNAGVLTSRRSWEQGASGGGGVIHGELGGIVDDHMPRRDGLAVGGLPCNWGRRHCCSLFGGGNRGWDSVWDHSYSTHVPNADLRGDVFHSLQYEQLCLLDGLWSLVCVVCLSDAEGRLANRLWIFIPVITLAKFNWHEFENLQNCFCIFLVLKLHFIWKIWVLIDLKSNNLPIVKRFSEF